MSTISVPLPATLDEYVTNAVRRGDAASKADLVRRALRRFAEDEAINDVLRSQQEMREGKVMYGDLRKIVKKMP